MIEPSYAQAIQKPSYAQARPTLETFSCAGAVDKPKQNLVCEWTLS
jgi:hypothetical protein